MDPHVVHMITSLAYPQKMKHFECSFSRPWKFNNFFLGLTFFDAQPITVGVASFRGYASIDWGGMTGSAIISMIPMVLFAAFAQKHIVGTRMEFVFTIHMQTPTSDIKETPLHLFIPTCF